MPWQWLSKGRIRVENRLEKVVLCDAVRTPFTHGNRMQNIKPEKLLELVIRSLVTRNDFQPERLSGVVTGTVLQDSRNPNIARMAAVLSELPHSTADYTIQNNCNSAFMGLLSALGNIVSGMGELYIATGVESMSRYGFGLRDLTGEYDSVSEIYELLGNERSLFDENFQIVNCLEECLTDHNNNVSMIEIGEIMANCFHISRREQDSYTHANLKKAVNAVKENSLNQYLCVVDGIEKDSYPLNRQKMLKRPELFDRAAEVFGKENSLLNPKNFFLKHKKHLEELGVEEIIPSVTMYNSSIPGDGAGGCIIAHEDTALEMGLIPRFRLINWAVSGVNPVIMGIGPCESTEKLFSHPRTSYSKGLTIKDMDQIEIHEAFAAQVLSVFKESLRKYRRKWDREIINPYGGSLAYTHPLGATNYRMMTNVFAWFDQHREAEYALLTGCAGGAREHPLFLKGIDDSIVSINE